MVFNYSGVNVKKLLLLFLFFIAQPAWAGMPVNDLDVYGNLCFKNVEGELEYCLPMEDGPSGYVLQTDGQGNVFWSVEGSDVGFLGQLADVDIANVQEGDFLYYQDGQWVVVQPHFTVDEEDPIFVASPAYEIDGQDIVNWDTAFDWGDHGQVGYLTDFTETDPTVPVHVKGITNIDIVNWDTAFDWGDHSTENYLTLVVPTDIYATNTPEDGWAITYDNGNFLWAPSGVGQTAWGFIIGDIEDQTDLIDYIDTAVSDVIVEETDPVFSAHVASNITQTDIDNWNLADVNVQSDWSQSDSTADDYILNKPDLSNFITSVDWNEIEGNQSDVNVGGFSNDVGYLTQVTPADLDTLNSPSPYHLLAYVNGSFGWMDYVVESLSTYGGQGTVPMSDGSGSLIMSDVITPTDIDSIGKLEALVGEQFLFDTLSIQNIVGNLFLHQDSSHHLVNFFYDNPPGAISAVIDDNLANYDNTVSGFITSTDLPTIPFSFNTFLVVGQNDIIAETINDSFTFQAGTNISLTTNPVTNTLTITSADIPPPTWDEVTEKPVTAFGTAFTNSDLVDGLLHVEHNLNQKYCVVNVYDNNDVTIIPRIIAADENNLTLDLSDWLPEGINGTWSIRAVIAGGDVSRGLESLTVGEVDETPLVANVDTILFDQGTGFIVTDNLDGSVTVALGSHFKTITIPGQDSIVATGQDTLNLDSSGGISLFSDAGTNTLTIDGSGIEGGKVKASSTDTTANYLSNKLFGGTNINIVRSNVGANEIMTINADDSLLGTQISSGNHRVSVHPDARIDFTLDNVLSGQFTPSELRIIDGRLEIEESDFGFKSYFMKEQEASAFSIVNQIYTEETLDDYAVDFDGDTLLLYPNEYNEYIQFPFSISAIIQPAITRPADHYGQGHIILTTDRRASSWSVISQPTHGFSIWLDEFDKISVAFANGSEGSGKYRRYRTHQPVLSTTSPTHLLVVFNAWNDVRVYANGTQRTVVTPSYGAGSATTVQPEPSHGPCIGGVGFRGQEDYIQAAFQGKIDEVAFFSADKSGSLSNFYSNGEAQRININEPDLIFLSRFDEGAGSLTLEEVTGLYAESKYPNGLLKDMDWIPGLTADPASFDSLIIKSEQMVEGQGKTTLTSYNLDQNIYGFLDLDGKNIDLKIEGTSKLFITDDNRVFIYNLKSGSDQAGAGAIVDELWQTQGHATLPDGVLMIGQD